MNDKMRETRPTETESVEAQPPTEALTSEPLTPEQIEDLKNRAARADENWERLLRVTADMDNFKMAMAAAGQARDNTAQSLQTGVTMIHQQLKNVLQEAGLQEVDAAGKT